MWWIGWMDGGDDDSGDDGGSQPNLLKRTFFVCRSLFLYFQNSMNEKGNSRMLCQCRFNSLSPFYWSHSRSFSYSRSRRRNTYWQQARRKQRAVSEWKTGGRNEQSRADIQSRTEQVQQRKSICSAVGRSVMRLIIFSQNIGEEKKKAENDNKNMTC